MAQKINYDIQLKNTKRLLTDQNDDYGLTIPNTTSWAADKTIATTNDIQTALTPTTLPLAPLGYTTESGVEGYNGIIATVALGTSSTTPTWASNGKNGLYIFTYGNCYVLIPIYNPTLGTEYKVAGTLVDSNGSYTVKTLTYKAVVTTVTSSVKRLDLKIYQKENIIPTGYTAYIFYIPLY